MRRHLLIAVVAVVAAFGAAGASAQPALRFATPLVVAKTCHAGYTHAVIGGAQKCLRAGEFCAHRYDRQYQRYGYRCILYDANVARYRLTRA